MRPAHLATLLLPTLATAALHPVYNNHADARHIKLAHPAAAPAAPPAPTPAADLNLREVVNAPAANQPASSVQQQYPSITTQWVETVTNGVTTWVEMIYTQQFASVVQQAPAPGEGAIGLGTLTGAVGVVKTDVPRSDAVAVRARNVVGGTADGSGWRWRLGWSVLGMIGVGGGMVML